MKIRYKGGRSHYEVTFNRKPYHFTRENNMVIDIREQMVINYIFSLPNRAEFEAVIEEINLSEPEGTIPQKLSEPVGNVLPKITKNKAKKRKGGK